VSRVLGYGALLDPAHVLDLCGREHVRRMGVGTLRGYRRHWNLVYRNGCWDEGRYVDRATGEPFDGGVAFLGVHEAVGIEMPVREIEVDAAGLAAIDEEEYMYRRVDVSATHGGPAPVWLYVDVAEDFFEGRYEGPSVVVASDYRNMVENAAAALVPDGAEQFAKTTAPCPWPVRDLAWRRG
jgi:hypothetical protein